jgi:acetyl esterase/lipase
MIDWKLSALRPSVYPTPDELVTRREGVFAMLSIERAPDVDVSQAEYGGVPCVVCRPESPVATILYFHGGGYRMGSPDASIAFMTRMAAATRARVVGVRYRLAPENPFPAAVADATEAYAALRTESSDAVVAVGDSAGGGLAAALAVACLTADATPPNALILMSPWLDLNKRSSTHASRPGYDELFSAESANEASAMYLQGHDPGDPLASPLSADLEAFPPTLIFASTDEVLLSDSVALARRLAEAGVEVMASFQPGRPHAWPAVFPADPASADALVEMGRFLARCGHGSA